MNFGMQTPSRPTSRFTDNVSRASLHFRVAAAAGQTSKMLAQTHHTHAWANRNEWAMHH